MGSLHTLWLTLAYAPVAPAPAPAPAAPVTAPAPAPGTLVAPQAAPAPAPSPQPEAAQPEAVAAEPAPTPEATDPAEPTAVASSSPAEAISDEPVAVTAAAQPTLEAEPARTHTVTVVHRKTRSTSYVRPSQPTRSEPEPFFVSGYGGITTRFSGVARKMGALRGVHGGLLLGDRLTLGAAYHRLKRRYGAPILDANDRPMALAMAYGGVELGATVVRRGRFELGLQTLLGAGAACVTYDVNTRSRSATCVDGVRMMVFEPSAIANITVTDWMRLGFEGGYRGVARSEWRPPTDFDLSGGYFGFNIDFGWFARD
ncbi:MAG: hypothetical protein AAGA54_00545 [Myxococcota bacterium]